MKEGKLHFQIHDAGRGRSFSLPSVQDYQEEKRIKVVAASPLNFGPEADKGAGTCSHHEFIAHRLEAALALLSNTPSYFPGQTIPGPGSMGLEVNRGNLLIEQFRHLLNFDEKACARLLQTGNDSYSLYSVKVPAKEVWRFNLIEKPSLSFLYQAEEPARLKSPDIAAKAYQVLKTDLIEHYAKLKADNCPENLQGALKAVARAWHKEDGRRDLSKTALTAAYKLWQHYSEQGSVNEGNFMAFAFELEALAFHQTAKEKLGLLSFAGGVFADNYVQIALMPLAKIQATEFCVRERLFDEVINLVGRGFAPVVVNEHGLVADGNHRVTAAWIWNFLKYTAGNCKTNAKQATWSLDDPRFQREAANFFLQSSVTGAISDVSRHEILSHLAAYLSNPECRAKLQTYIKPQLSKYEYVTELPVVLLPEYLSCAVVKGLYDEGKEVVRACPSLYEEMAANPDLVLPPRASYHFTDAALLPWFQVLSKRKITDPEGSQTDHGMTRRIPTSARREAMLTTLTTDNSLHKERRR